MSVWQNVAPWVNRFFGDVPDRPDIEPAQVEAAIHVIQQAMDGEQSQRLGRKLRVIDLDPEHQNALALELAELLKNPPTRERGVNGVNHN